MNANDINVTIIVKQRRKAVSTDAVVVCVSEQAKLIFSCSVAWEWVGKHLDRPASWRKYHC